MTETNEIQIFVSCPGDVETEKNIVKKVCNDLNEDVRDYFDIRFIVREWKTIVGNVGERPQEIINNKIKNYDIYLGIWWMRFGPKTGKTNPSTGEEYESGTQEEFLLAYESWNLNKFPLIYLFVKKPKPTLNYNETVQLSKVQKFLEEQKQNEWVNQFQDEIEFQSHVYKVLHEKLFKLNFSKRVEQKINFINELPFDKIEEFKNSIASSPREYIPRSTSHFKALRDKIKIPFLEIEKQALDQLMLTKMRVVLLGDAGSGKSTELINLFHKLSTVSSSFVPLLQKFNSYTPDIGIEAFLPDFWKQIPNNLLLIIWDGLDEIQPEHFNTVVRQINAFSEKYKQVRILISCRTNFYELPINNSTGTLLGFEPYLINDLTNKDAIDYYQLKYSVPNAEGFLNEVFDNNITDLIEKPFFLMLLADNYARDQKLSLNRAELYEMFLINRIELDQTHFKTTVDIRSKKLEIIKQLQKLALSMEILSKNQIHELEILELLKEDEFTALKYCTAFKKKDGEDDIWQFEHNNIQEFLAAKALSNIEFGKVIRFIAFEPNYKKLIPSWVNTLAFLFSILKINEELFKRLLEWMLNNEKEVIVKFEPDKVPEILRNQIFQGIFNHYKEHDVWVRSNKFDDKELARFGQSETNLSFLIEELENEKNTRTVNINAIQLLGYFEIRNEVIRKEVEVLFLKHIENNIGDPNFIHAVIYALKYAELTGKNTIDKLMDMVGKQKNQYVRSSIYAILLKSNVLEMHIDYLIEGCDLIEKKNSGERSDVSLMDEGWNLNECIKNVRSPKGIKKITSYIAENIEFEYGYDIGMVLESIISNAIKAYSQDSTVFDVILNLFQKDIRGYRMEKMNLILQFFEQTKTREKAFYKIWESTEDEERNKSIAIAKLITPELMQFIIDEYHNHNLTNKELESIYIGMWMAGDEKRNKFEELIHEKTDFVLKRHVQIDYERLRKTKISQDFNLLFDKSAFKKATLRIFVEQHKDFLSFDELFEIRKENNKWVDIEETYSGVALRLLRDFVNKGQSIKKEKVINWFENEGNVESYRVSLIYEYLTNYKDIEINQMQKNWIINWCKENVYKVNFNDAIKVHEDGSITYATNALYIWSLSRRFNIDYFKEVLLDMLSFDFFEGKDWVGIEYPVSKLNHEDIVNRMLENLKKGIEDNSVLKNHIKYLAQNKVEESYPFILSEIINFKRRDHYRNEFLDVFFEYTKNIQSLKTIIDKSDSAIKWAIIDKLKTNNEELFVEKYLLKEMNSTTDSIEKGKASAMLVTLQNIDGLKVYIDWLKDNVDNYIDNSHVMCLTSLKTEESIPYLLELLELSYLKEERKIDRFNQLNSQVLGAFYNVALVSEGNFVKVKFNLEQFINEKSSINENVKYILLTIERIEAQFYMNRAQSYSIQQVIEKLKLVEN
jgi:hypothetical protein